MAKIPSVQVTPDELAALFQALAIWEKIGDERFTSLPLLGRRRPSHGFPGGASDIVRHSNQAGYHVATTHAITMPDGSVPHWDAKDLHIGDIVIWAL
jgi:hypothetical protein